MIRTLLLLAILANTSACHTPAYVVASKAAIAASDEQCPLAPKSETWMTSRGIYIVKVECPTFGAYKIDENGNRKPAGTKAKTILYRCEMDKCELLKGSTLSESVSVREPKGSQPDLSLDVDPDFLTEASPAVAQGSEASSGDSAALRSELDGRSRDILACTGSDNALVMLQVADQGVVIVSLRGALAGSPEEGCVRSVLSDLSSPDTAPIQFQLLHLVKEQDE